jgi:hypothetical protein
VSAPIIASALLLLVGCSTGQQFQATNQSPPQVPTALDRYDAELSKQSAEIDRRQKAWEKMPDGPEKQKETQELLMLVKAYNEAVKERNDYAERMLHLINESIAADAMQTTANAQMMQALQPSPAPTPIKIQVQQVPYPYGTYP